MGKISRKTTAVPRSDWPMLQRRWQRCCCHFSCRCPAAAPTGWFCLFVWFSGSIVIFSATTDCREKKNRCWSADFSKTGAASREAARLPAAASIKQKKKKKQQNKCSTQVNQKGKAIVGRFGRCRYQRLRRWMTSSSKHRRRGTRKFICKRLG